MPKGPNSRAMLWANPRKAILPPENPAKFALPLNEAVAPVKMIVPFWLMPFVLRSESLTLVTMRLATSRPFKNPAKQAISHIFV